tara:strand:- start:316 stop:1500 length:1185 start_codon:yes stop_codon:yes gene_type:complete
MEIVHILARGVEGCGVTKFSVEFRDWCRANGHTYNMYAPLDKKWSRHKSHEMDDTCHQWKWGNKPARGQEDFGVEKVIEACNKADCTFISSLPSKSHPQECIDNYIELLNRVTKPMHMIQHDHNMQSISRNAALMETIDRADVIYAFNKESKFATYVNAKSGKKIVEYINGMNMQRIKDKYWKPIEEQDVDHLKWIGRCTGWKGMDIVFDLANQYKAKYTLEGLEKSIGFVQFRKDFDFHEVNGAFDMDFQVGKPYVLDPYNHHNMMERLSKCAFGFQLTYLDPRFIKSFLEYTHLEVAACGTIPIFRKAYGDACMNPHTGNQLTEDKDTGTLWAPEVGGDMQDLMCNISKLQRDHVLRDEMRHKAFEYYNKHSHGDYAFNLILNKAHEFVLNQ